VSLMAAPVAATVYLYIVIPKGFFPTAGQRHHQGTTEAAQDISYAAMVERVHELAKVVMADPDGRAVYYWSAPIRPSTPVVDDRPQSRWPNATQRRRR